MCDDAKIQGVVESGALDGIINSKVEKVIVNDDTTKEALYKKGCGLRPTLAPALSLRVLLFVLSAPNDKLS